MRWNKEKLIDTYMEKAETLLDEAGLGSQSIRPPQIEVMSGTICEICFENGDEMRTYAMVCNHRYCADCYAQYLTQKVKEEGEAARIQCPRDGCRRIVDTKSLKLLVDDKIRER